MIITRYPYQVDDILHSESLNCHPAENQAAKIFVKWLKEHPEFNEIDVDMRIDSREREEDYYATAAATTNTCAYLSDAKKPRRSTRRE